MRQLTLFTRRFNLLKSLAVAGSLAAAGTMASAQSVYPGGYDGQPAVNYADNGYMDNTPTYDNQNAPDVEGGYVDPGQFEQPLSPYGRWVTVANYGRAWVPANVAQGWRPYTLGHWVWTDCGWAWVSDEAFGWATYHYGRWMLTAQFGWVWVPGSVWAPAWVDWRMGGGYIGWAPLPPRPGFQFALSVGAYDNYSVPATYFNFCAERDFIEPHVDRHFLPHERNVTIINNTVNITNIKVVNHRVVDRSVAVDRIERVRGERIAPLAVRQVNRVGDAKVVAGKELAVYRPAGKARADVAAKTAVRNTAVNRANTAVNNRAAITAKAAPIRTAEPAKAVARPQAKAAVKAPANTAVKAPAGADDCADQRCGAADSDEDPAACDHTGREDGGAHERERAEGQYTDREERGCAEDEHDGSAEYRGAEGDDERSGQGAREHRGPESQHARGESCEGPGSADGKDRSDSDSVNREEDAGGRESCSSAAEDGGESSADEEQCCGTAFKQHQSAISRQEHRQQSHRQQSQRGKGQEHREEREDEIVPAITLRTGACDTVLHAPFVFTGGSANSLFLRADLFLDALDVAAAEGLHLAAQLEVAADLVIAEDAEAVDDGQRPAGPFHDVVGLELEVGRVAHGEHDGIDALEGGRQVLLDAQVGDVGLVVEEARPGMAGRG